ncbi:MAG TPA: glycoside hydrolase family 48 protein [Terracidiphilus sp.]|nr:glycoside hydrolase family 48 protein [Terracidiphilus sp.]
MFQRINNWFGPIGGRGLGCLAGALAALLLTAAAPSILAQSCSATYTIQSTWPGNFAGGLTITNTGTTAISSWTLTWTYSGNQQITQLWNGTVTQSGQSVKVTNLSYNGAIPVGGSYSSAGFNASVTGTNAVPAVTCLANGSGSSGGFTLAASASSLSIAQGATGTDTLTVTDVSPFNGSVSLAASGMPTGVTASFGTNPATASSVVTFSVASTTAAGNYPITITGTSGTLTPASTSITLTVTAASGFTLTPAASTLSIAQGASKTDTITVTDTGSFTGSVTLAASGMPSGVSATFSTNPATASSVVTFAVGSTTPVGSYPIAITGTSGTLAPVTTSITITVAAPPSFTLASSASTVSVTQGSNATDTITVTDAGGFTGSVTLAASSLPSGVTATFGTNPATGTSVVTFAASSSATTGTFPVTITGTSGSLSASASFTLTVGTASTGACQVVYTISPQNSTAFGAAITIENTSTTALSSWTLTWTFANGQTVSSLWNGIASQSGANVTVTNEPYNGSIPAGGSVTGIGFNGTWSGTNSVPTNFAVNGTLCGGVSTGSFTLKPSASTLSVAPGASGTDTIAVSDVSPFAGSVTFAASGMPTGVTASFSPVSSTSSSVVTFSVASTVAAGSYPITITGTSGTLTPVTTSITLTVTGAPGFTISVSPTALVVALGGTGTATLTTTDVNGFTGNITCSLTGLPSGITDPLPAGTKVIPGSTALTFTVPSTAVAGASTLTVTCSSGSITNTLTFTLTISAGFTTFQQHFVDLYNDIHTSSNGYFGTATSGDKIPYHSVETLMAEAPDYGHETSSETYSYWIWLETLYGGLTENWTGLQTAWTSMEDNMIPSAALQPTNSGYNASSPATYAPEHPLPGAYPSTLTSSVSVGNDPLASQLSSTYGNSNMYSMHWIIDTDNFYGFGQQEDGVTKPSCMNTFQRGANESVWLTVPQPCWDALKYGSSSNGYLDLFTAPSPYTAQWKYTDAPDADARTVQAMYWAEQYADAQGGSSIVTSLLPKAAKLGDYLRYAMFDKYFKAIGCVGASASATGCAAGSGYSSAHYLLGWYFAWGGALPSAGSWAWRIGDGSTHFGYQNPVAAFALSKDAGISGNLPAQSVTDWSTSLERQLELYRWLQSDEGAIAGGATNSWEGSYSPTPTGDSTFYNMAYDWEPVYHNPPSNQWFGMQTWSMERLAEYYYITGDSKAAIVLNSWIPWVEKVTTVNANGTFTLPGSLCWDDSPGQGDTTNPWNDSTCGLVTSGTANQPATNWNAATQDWTTVPLNPNLHVRVTGTATDIGLAGSLAKALAYYSAAVGKWSSSKTPDATSEALAKSLLTGIWTNYRDSIGISVAETRSDYCTSTTSTSTNGSTTLNGGFGATVFVPSTWAPGTMPAGEDVTVSPQPTFLSLRPKYKQDPSYALVQSGCSGTGAGPTFNYHRFWAQVDIASAYLVFANLFPGN